ncbi:putative phage abortive infection protein [Mangrovimonas futianensis]|uniref:putative phage abortive infection protein n=1 Tax=Mangrovimonas futianensis TaxID=2895523 RepID=UPI001E548988|nr:putative phage abortive infection protein [Mangrovimonas futianensis]MCF1420313.1 putative phage abortive infection protein [Mangrovimonas futianensis]
MKVNLSKREVVVFGIVGVLLMLLPIAFSQFSSGVSFMDTGQIGDTIGGITAPFLSFFGSILVFLALKAQIDANQLINEQFKEQKIIDYRQNFESTFFNLLNNHHHIVENIDAPANLIYASYKSWLFGFFHMNKVRSLLYNDINKPDILKGRDVFKQSALVLRKFLEDDIYLNQRLYQKDDKNNIYHHEFEAYLLRYKSIKKFKESTINLNGHVVKSDFNSIYHKIYIAYNTDYGHYFRNLYRMIKIIDEMQFDKDEVTNFKIQYSYTSIIRAQLSDYELVWLFFNCIHSNGNEKFKPLIEKYTIFKNMDKNNMVFNFYKDLYIESAFKKPVDISNHLSKLQNTL